MRMLTRHFVLIVRGLSLDSISFRACYEFLVLGVDYETICVKYSDMIDSVSNDIDLIVKLYRQRYL